MNLKLELLFHHFSLFRSVRHGFARYAIGGLVAAAKTLFQEDIKMDIRHDWSTKECKLHNRRHHLIECLYYDY